MIKFGAIYWLKIILNGLIEHKHLYYMIAFSHDPILHLCVCVCVWVHNNIDHIRPEIKIKRNQHLIFMIIEIEIDFLNSVNYTNANGLHLATLVSMFIFLSLILDCFRIIDVISEDGFQSKTNKLFIPFVWQRKQKIVTHTNHFVFRIMHFLYSFIVSIG